MDAPHKNHSHHLLDVRHLVTKFHTQEGVVHAVNDISYRVDKGESLAIVGESGCGKTAGALSIMRLVPDPGVIESGQIFYKGQDILQLPESQMRFIRGKEIGMVFQDPGTSLNPVLSIGTQLLESVKAHLDLTDRQARARVVDLLKMVGIPNADNRLNDYPHQFSGGQRQRIIIANALSCNPSLLIADEPTTALDVTIQAQIVHLIKRLRDEFGMAIIWITHDLGVVAGLVDRVAVMYAGKMVEIAPVRDLYKQTSHPYTLGLLRSLPRIGKNRPKRLVPIPGHPPNLREEYEHCPFADRCSHAVNLCWKKEPPLEKIATGHYTACWRWEDVRKGIQTNPVRGQA